MRSSGELVLWNDEKGYGFIAGDDGQRSFVHVSSIKQTATRPQPGDRVTFLPGTGKDGRPAAISVVILGARPRQVVSRSRPAAGRSALGGLFRISGAVLILFGALAATQLAGAPIWMPVAYLLLGVLSIVFYWVDKSAAEDGRWRVSEATLHGLDLVGGIAGGLVAQQLLRHKTRKQSFIVTTLLIALLHIGGLVLLMLGYWSLPILLG